ncbi:MAG: hypothetical protein IJV43_02560 [Oscillospiraceae bacterium]|nr:hypothetical protein [Oscillospiraceae bacterium]
MKKRIGSVLLTLAMALALLPAAAVPARASGGIINTDVTWIDGLVISDEVTITGSNDAANPVTVTVNGTVTVNNTITVTSGYVTFTGSGTLKHGAASLRTACGASFASRTALWYGTARSLIATGKRATRVVLPWATLPGAAPLNCAAAPCETGRAA